MILIGETIQHTYRRLNQESDTGKGGRKGPERNHGLSDQRGPSGRDTCTRKRLLHAGRIFIGDGLRFWQCRTSEHGEKARVRDRVDSRPMETGGLAVHIELGVRNSKSRGCKVQDAKRRGGVGAEEAYLCLCQG